MPKKVISKSESAPAPVVAAPVETAPIIEKKSKKVAKNVEAPTPAPVVAAPANTEEVVQEGGRKIRYFKCIYEGETFGRFSGYKPKQAAGKALTSILRSKTGSKKQAVNQEISYSMIECTRGRAHKVSQYVGKRVKLEKPNKVTIKSKDEKGNVVTKVIEYEFTNKITKIKASQQEGGKVATKKTTKATKKSAKKTVKSTKKVAKAVEAPIVAAPVEEKAAPKAKTAKTASKKATK